MRAAVHSPRLDQPTYLVEHELRPSPPFLQHQRTGGNKGFPNNKQVVQQIKATRIYTNFALHAS